MKDSRDVNCKHEVLTSTEGVEHVAAILSMSLFLYRVFRFISILSLIH